MYFTYVRVSSESQEKKLTYKTQQFKINERVKQDGITIDKEYYDQGSGKNLNREDLQKLLNELIEHPGSTIYTYDLYRLTREPRDWFILQDLFVDTQTKIIGVDSEIEFETDEGEFMAGLKTLLGRLERKKTNRRIKDGVQRKYAETGRWGPTPKIKDKRFDYYYFQKEITNKTSLAKLLGVSRTTIYNYMKKRKIGIENG